MFHGHCRCGVEAPLFLTAAIIHGIRPSLWVRRTSVFFRGGCSYARERVHKHQVERAVYSHMYRSPPLHMQDGGPHGGARALRGHEVRASASRVLPAAPRVGCVAPHPPLQLHTAPTCIEHRQMHAFGSVSSVRSCHQLALATRHTRVAPRQSFPLLLQSPRCFAHAPEFDSLEFPTFDSRAAEPARAHSACSSHWPTPTAVRGARGR